VTGVPAPEGAESITEAELTRALIHVEHSGGKQHCSSCREKAVSLLSHVKAGREPEYEPGEIYEDDAGDRFMRMKEPPGGCWMELRANGSTALRGNGTPYRPLRKLVPEGSQEAAAILVAEWRGLGEQDDAVPEWRGGYRAALRKCADELGYALKEGQR
jgi:hypothetical protein